MESIISLDQQLFLWLNEQHSAFWDPIWGTITARNTWIPLYVVLIAGFIWRWRWQGVLAVLCMALAVIVADQIASGIMKPFFARPRPCHEPLLAGKVHTVNNKCGGPYGFASSHAANSFAVGMFVWLSFRRHLRWVGIALLLWAAVVSYSRVYVGVHYPGDILAGALVGLGCATLFWQLLRRISRRYFNPHL